MRCTEPRKRSGQRRAERLALVRSEQLTDGPRLADPRDAVAEDALVEHRADRTAGVALHVEQLREVTRPGQAGGARVVRRETGQGEVTGHTDTTSDTPFSRARRARPNTAPRSSPTASRTSVVAST